jgi:septal ring-binding cell division protein DamX
VAVEPNVADKNETKDRQNTGAISEQIADRATIISEQALLQHRLEKTQSWMKGVDQGHYSIQLFLARQVDSAAVEGFLQSIPPALDLDKVYIYEAVMDGQRKYSVLYNNFVSRQEAQTKLDSLPEALQANLPFLRRIDTIVLHAPSLVAGS